MSNQSDTTGLPGKILSHDAGLGTIAEETISSRARELAEIDGRREANELDLAQARRDLMAVDADEDTLSAPELDSPELENITEWDTPLQAAGSQAKDLYGDEEESIASTLFHEGLDEADHDQRLNAVRENPPEEEV